MKKTLMMILFIGLAISMMWGQGLEDFTNSNTTASYLNGSFVGNGDITWTYGHSRNVDTFPIDGKGHMLRRASDSYIEATIPGGIGNFSFQYRKAYTGTAARQLEVFFNGTQSAVTPEFGTISGEETDVYILNITDVNLTGAVTVKIKNVGTTTTNRQTILDNISWTAYAGTPGENVPPAISGIIQSPTAIITSSTTVSVSADVTDVDGTVSLVQLKWGTEPGTYPNTINMSSAKGTYTTDTAIPAQADGTTVYYVVYAEDNEDGTATSAPNNYTVVDPATTTLPYLETFDANLGDCLVYNASGASKQWVYASGTAYMSGYNTGDLEEDWLILPGINMNNYIDELMVFDTKWQYGTDDADNYLKLLYSTNYTGLGDPNEADWTELTYTQPASATTWASSGNIDLSGIAGTSVYFAFKYNYSAGMYRNWSVDNINIYEAAMPLLSVNPSTLSGFSYAEGSGPSAPQTFVVSGENLIDDITVSTPTNFEIALSADGAYGTELILTAAKTTVGETTIYARMIAGLAVGSFPDEVITISSDGALDASVTCNGTVTQPPLTLPLAGYYQNFASFIGNDSLPTGWTVSNNTYIGDWGSGTSAGLRGNESVLGFQHTSSSGIFTASISLKNATGAIIEDLRISYLGRVARTDQTRSPIWTVTLNGTEVPDLTYSTEAGVDETRVAYISGLNIAPNETFTIAWSSDRGLVSGGSKQIGISEVSVATYSYPQDEPIVEQGVTIVIGGGDAYAGSGTIPAVPNAGFTPSAQFTFVFDDTTPNYTITIQTDAAYGAYYLNGQWHVVLGNGTEIVFNIDLSGAKGNVEVPIILGDEDPTLPVELSSFNAIFSAENYVQLTWVTESETNVNGYYVYRSATESLLNAQIISPLIDATNSSSQHTYNYKDSEIYADGLYYYWLQNVDIDGSSSYHGPVSVMVSFDNDNPGTPEIPMQTALNAVFPNPFNPSTNVAYSLAEKANVKISIFNSRGQLVKTLINTDQAAGHHRIHWNGKDSFGNDCSSGIYFIRMQAGKDSFSRKALLMK